MVMSDINSEKLAHIDSARAIAILMVIMVHTAGIFSGLSRPVYVISALGQLGVQLFFVASA